MIFADKLIQLRKKSGWSQEDLAEKMDVSRQSVTKWECAQSIPELSKIIRLSELFGVSIDYLLKDELEDTEYIKADDTPGVRRVSLEEANVFLETRKKAAKPIAIGTFLCMLSPICLLMLAALSEKGKYGIGENVAVGIGLCVLLVMVAVAVALFVSTGNKNRRFEYLEKEGFETEYGVSGLVKEHINRYREIYDRFNIIGSVLCILSAIPLFIGATANGDGVYMVAMVCLTLLAAAVGVTFFVIGGVRWSSFQKLLQEGDFTKEKKEHSAVKSAVTCAYWMIAVAVFLACSFASNDWQNTWIVWPIAGVLFPAVLALCNVFMQKK